MILTYETNPVGNILKVITGIESEAMLKMHGTMVVDITRILSQFNPGKPVFLSIGRTDSEQQTVSLLKLLDLKAPFMAPLTVINTNNNGNEIGAIADSKDNKTNANAIGVSIVKGKCANCGIDAQLVKIGRDSGICPSCIKLDMGLAKSKGKSHAVKVCTK